MPINIDFKDDYLTINGQDYPKGEHLRYRQENNFEYVEIHDYRTGTTILPRTRYNELVPAGIPLTSPMDVQVYFQDRFFKEAGIGGGASAGFFTQSGNAFGAMAVLGTTDSNPLSIVANGAEVLRLLTTGRAQFAGPVSLGTAVSDPVGAPDGTMYYNASTNKLRMQQGGVFVDVTAGGDALLNMPNNIASYAQRANMNLQGSFSMNTKNARANGAVLSGDASDGFKLKPYSAGSYADYSYLLSIDAT